MPRYYFHVDDGVSRRDEEGTELRDAEAARQEAVQCASEILMVCRDHVCEGHPWTMRVTDDANRLLLTLRFELTMEPAFSLPIAKPLSAVEPPAADR